MLPLTSIDVIVFLAILVGILLVVVLYHLLFLLKDVRTIVKRVDRVTEQVEDIVLRPLAIMDQALANIMALFDKGEKKGKKEFNHRKIG